MSSQARMRNSSFLYRTAHFAVRYKNEEFRMRAIRAGGMRPDSRPDPVSGAGWTGMPLAAVIIHIYRLKTVAGSAMTSMDSMKSITDIWRYARRRRVLMAMLINLFPKHNWRLRHHLQVPSGNITDPNQRRVSRVPSVCAPLAQDWSRLGALGERGPSYLALAGWRHHAQLRVRRGRIVLWLRRGA